MPPRLTLRRVDVGDRSFGDDVRAGLTAPRKSLPPRWFYDALGSALFEAICNLPEYYLTRAETEILQRSAEKIAKEAGSVARVVELGSGSSRKTRLILDAVKPPVFVPIDIDAHALEMSGRELVTEYKKMRVDAVCSNFTHARRVLENVIRDGRTLLVFLGSTIGNFEPRDATALVRDLGDVLHPGDLFLLGADLKKPKPLLDAAYDDALGVTAAFNLNMLCRINSQLGGRFDVRQFRHRAFYEEEKGRIEMYLESKKEQTVRIDGLKLEVHFDEGETIHTENSYKYSKPELVRMAMEAELDIVDEYSDSRRMFTDVLMQVR